MQEFRNQGQTIEFDLPEECGYSGYYVRCTYCQSNTDGKYLLAMYLFKPGKNKKLNIGMQEIDCQCISGTEETIVENICRIVQQASLSGFFEKYIRKYEYMERCLYLGNKIKTEKKMKEKERLHNNDE